MKVKKILLMLGIVLIFTAPTFVHAEEMNSEKVPDNQKVEKVDSKKTASEVSKSNKEELDLFTYQAEKMSSATIDEKLKELSLKSDLTDVEKEKVKILIDEDKESINENKEITSVIVGAVNILGYIIMGFLFLDVVFDVKIRL